MEPTHEPTPDCVVEVRSPAGILAIAAFFMEGVSDDILTVVTGTNDPLSIAAVCSYLEIARDALLSSDWNLLLPDAGMGEDDGGNDLPF